MKDNDTLNLLIAKYLNNELTAEDRIIVEDWIIKHPKEFDFLQSAYASTRKNFDSDRAWSEVATELSLSNSTARMHKSRYIWISIAASLLILFALTQINYSSLFTELSQTVELTANTTIEKYRLEDGTTVTLFPDSKLTYIPAKPHHNQEVHLAGRAYFEVTRDPQRQFSVATSQLNVVVYGTKFIVDTQYQEQSNLVIVRQGVVGVTNLATSRELKLRKNQSVLLNDTAFHYYTDYNPNDYVEATHEFIFTNAPLQEVVHQLENHFSCTITLPNKENSCRVTASFKQQKLEEIMHELQQILNFKYRKTVNGYEITELLCQ